MRVIIFILLFPFNSIAQDALLEAMFRNWSMSKEEQDPEYSDSYSEFPNDYEAEVYHWELGTPDNIPEIEIIYQDPNPCGLTYH
jgi:hypothetical protein